MLNDMAAYMNNQGAANDGKHANLPSLFWCVLVYPQLSCVVTSILCMPPLKAGFDPQSFPLCALPFCQLTGH